VHSWVAGKHRGIVVRNGTALVWEWFDIDSGLVGMDLTSVSMILRLDFGTVLTLFSILFFTLLF
jgi:hypothetical protein